MTAAELVKAVREKEQARVELRKAIVQGIYDETVESMLDQDELETDLSIYNIERICNTELDGVMFYDLIRDDIIPLFVKNGFSAVWNEDEGDNRILIWAPIGE
ncbi:hypothetical protein [Aeromonas phage AS-zj]|uniref:Uncharacterized protein n=1 Tax=Aeromonas phage AS-zj TaxID=2024208 RepID=A0A223LEB0_9CAUD|nr:hypothetical protein HWB28_gp249 [Aeromonas phage AS-zj]ASU00303.1 hypothetical protein [Aeromonas phage AS-zj]